MRYRPYNYICCFLIQMVIVFSPLSGMAASEWQDVKGSQDHPLIKRYKGTKIIGYGLKEFVTFNLPLANCDSKKGTIDCEKKLEGRCTRILYIEPEGRSTLEIYRNYQEELENLGFKILFTCRDKECSNGHGRKLVRDRLCPRESELWNSDGSPCDAFRSPRDIRYLSAQKSNAQGDVFVSLAVCQEGNGGNRQAFGHAYILLDVVEPRPMEKRMVVVSAEEMAKNIDSNGRVALYGIYFDTNSTVVKPESRESLAEIHQLLMQRPKMKLYVVGHTDWEGEYEYNMDLSKRRALSVVKILTTQYSIARERLIAAGVGPLSPVAANETETGRAKNRRVELVPR